eukprot:TRINITY_DN13651_c0_g1_i2.p1 TRINITY_DN13651_c0_g1~~TRINITY_DN13651_c0_g1_i2.p1  ORF type:complete len:497 (-),score=54.21 TRINITY_DN13651_c0_g1_i2:717-2207(-)
MKTPSPRGLNGGPLSMATTRFVRWTGISLGGVTKDHAMDWRRVCHPRRWKRLLPSRSRMAIIALIFTNAVTVMTLYSLIPGMGLPQADDQGGRVGNSVERKFERGHGLQGFVFYSAYRISKTEFVAIGLSALVLHSLMKADVCRWRSSDGSDVMGKLSVLYPGDAHKKTYEAVIIVCTLEQESSAGGASGGGSGGGGGQLFMTIDREEVRVYQEKTSKSLPMSPYKSKLTYCSSPIYGEINEERFMEWIEYHQITHGIDYFHLYDAGGITPSLRARLKPYINGRMMTITVVREINQFETWLWAQLLVVNDCAYRTRFSTQWALFMDLDEYLYVAEPPHSIQPILKDNEGSMWLTFGSQFFYTDKCTHSANVSRGMQQPWAVEQMVFRQADVHCKNVAKYGNRTHCLEYDGHRKYIVDPRQIEVCGIHKVVQPAVGGLHTSSEDVHLNHFRGLNTRKTKSCTQFIHDTDPIPPSWARDFTLALAAREARGPSRQRLL